MATVEYGKGRQKVLGRVGLRSVIVHCTGTRKCAKWLEKHEIGGDKRLEEALLDELQEYASDETLTVKWCIEYHRLKSNQALMRQRGYDDKGNKGGKGENSNKGNRVEMEGDKK